MAYWGWRAACATGGADGKGAVDALVAMIKDDAKGSCSEATDDDPQHIEAPVSSHATVARHGTAALHGTRVLRSWRSCASVGLVGLRTR